MSEDGHRITEPMLVAAITDLLNDSSAEIKVKDLRVSEGSQKGDNFACVMKAVSVDAIINGENKTFEFMGKCIPLNPMRQVWIVQSKIFDKEVLAYTVILPQLRKLFKDGLDLGVPICYFGDDQVMLMENLKTDGYKLVPKRIGLDMTHIKLLLDKLSMLHAASYHWIQTYSGGFEKIKEDFALFFHNDGWHHGTEEMKAQFEGMMEKMFEGSTAIVEKFAPEKPELAQRMKKFGETLNSTLADVSLPKPGQFCSMLHGDCWNNNFMFKYDDEGNLKAIKVVDYQLMRYGCIAHDLAYFLCTSTSPEMRQGHLEEILDHYHGCLISHLAEFGYPQNLYPKESFRKDFNDCFAFGFITGIFIAQVILSEKAIESGGTMDMDDVQTEEEMAKKMETIDKKMLDEAADNIPLQERLVGLAQEAVDRNVI